MKNLTQHLQKIGESFDEKFNVDKDINGTIPDCWSYLQTKEIVQYPEPEEVKSHLIQSQITTLELLKEMVEGRKKTNPYIKDKINSLAEYAVVHEGVGFNDCLSLIISDLDSAIKTLKEI